MKRLLELEKPSIYNKNKKDIEEKIEILKPLKEENIDIYKYLVDMQKKFLKCVSKEIEAADKTILILYILLDIIETYI